MTHAPTRRHQLGRWRLPGRLRWLLGGNDHHLARARYGTRESASERAKRLERTARRTRRLQRARQVQAVARKGQQWEDAAYAAVPTPGAHPLDPAAAPSTLAMPLISGERGLSQGALPALPPGFAPATADERSGERTTGAPEPATGARASGKPVLYVVHGRAPAQGAARSRPMPERRASAAGTKAGSR